MFAFADFVKATTDTTGTGDITLASSPTGFRSFAQGFADQDVMTVLVVDNPSAPTQWEVFDATYNDLTTDTLTRGTLRSSSTGSRVNFSAGTKTVVPAPSALFFDLIAQAINADIDATGSSGAYAVTTPAGLAPTRGYRITFKANHDNPSGGTTINPDTLGAEAIKLSDGTDPYAGAIQQDGLYTVEYDGTNFQLQNPTIPYYEQAAATSLNGLSEVEFSVPSWARKFTLSVRGLSVSSTGLPFIQMGTASGFEANGYQGTTVATGAGGNSISNHSTSILMTTSVADGDLFSGDITFTMHDQATHDWSYRGGFGEHAANGNQINGGKATSTALTRVRLSVAGGGTFDAGTGNLLAEA